MRWMRKTEVNEVHHHSIDGVKCPKCGLVFTGVICGGGANEPKDGDPGVCHQCCAILKFVVRGKHASVKIMTKDEFNELRQDERDGILTTISSIQHSILAHAFMTRPTHYRS